MALALQAAKTQGLNKPVQCIGFGRKGHEGHLHWGVGHNHDEEILLWLDMWKAGTELVHLEWGEYREELLASVHPRTFVHKSIRMKAPEVAVEDMMKTMEAGLRNVQASKSMASVSKWYRHIPVEQLEDMATHGLITHPEDPNYLTCGWHTKRNC